MIYLVPKIDIRVHRTENDIARYKMVKDKKKQQKKTQKKTTFETLATRH